MAFYRVLIPKHISRKQFSHVHITNPYSKNIRTMKIFIWDIYSEFYIFNLDRLLLRKCEHSQFFSCDSFNMNPTQKIIETIYLLYAIISSLMHIAYCYLLHLFYMLFTYRIYITSLYIAVNPPNPPNNYFITKFVVKIIFLF
jgi:hypothetical protein